MRLELGLKSKLCTCDCEVSSVFVVQAVGWRPQFDGESARILVLTLAEPEYNTAGMDIKHTRGIRSKS